MDAVHPYHHTAGAVASCLGLLAAFFFLVTPADAVEHSEDAVKAAYLYRFAGYIDWPESSTADTPFVIDVLGAPGIARELQRVLPGHPINGQIAQVREISDARDVDTAQIVYAAAGHAGVLRSLVPRAGGASRLLVTDEEDGLNSGSTLNFLTVDRNVRFEVSLTAAGRWGLKISSELLGVAIRVRGRGGQSLLGCGTPSGIDAIGISCAPSVARDHSRRVLKPAASG